MNEENVLFNDVLDTFNLQLYGVRHVVKDHSDSERGNPLLLPRHGLLFLISISHSSLCSTTGVTKAMVCVILSVGWCI